MRKGEPFGLSWATRDLLFALLVVFMAMSVLALIAATKATQAGVTQGSLVITIDWRGSPDADVDLWVRAPGDAPVGYSHMSDAHCNLLRDDLGRAMDPESMAEEETVCRGIDPGEWIVDAMLYQLHGARFPIAVTAKVMRMGDGPIEQLLSKMVEVSSEGQQITIWRFTLDQKGDLARGSVNDLPLPLYGARQ